MKKYILVISENQESESLFHHILERLKDDFRIFYTKSIIEAINLFKIINPVLTLVNCNTLEINLEGGGYLIEFLAVKYNTQVLLYDSQTANVTYIDNRRESQPKVSTPENITETILELKSLIYNKTTQEKKRKNKKRMED